MHTTTGVCEPVDHLPETAFFGQKLAGFDIVLGKFREENFLFIFFVAPPVVRDVEEAIGTFRAIWISTPVEISIVCRRDPKNTPAKIQVDTNPSPGTKKGDPYNIPDNTDWQTATWKITDSQFVGKWGFHFHMDAGSYYVKSVTATKVEK